MKELVFIPMGNISEKAKEKLNKLRENQNKRIEQMKREFEEGKFTEFLKTL